jgi:hypothetical protein
MRRFLSISRHRDRRARAAWLLAGLLCISLCAGAHKPAVADAPEGTQPAADDSLACGPAVRIHADGPAPPGCAADLPAGAGPHLAVQYFHRNLRCVTCLDMEHRVAALLEDTFAERLAAGELCWQAFDYEAEENAVYVEAYGLGGGPALVIAHCEADRVRAWHEIEEVWSMTDRPDAIRALVAGRLTRCLESVAPPDTATAGTPPETTTKESGS